MQAYDSLLLFRNMSTVQRIHEWQKGTEQPSFKIPRRIEKESKKEPFDLFYL